MGLFDRIGKKISDTGMDVARQAKDFTEVNRLNAAIAAESKKMQEAYALLGKTYYTLYKGRYDEEVKSIIEAIESIDARIAQYRQQIQERERKLICTNCGAELPEEACFCSNCGKPVVRVEAALPPANSSAARCRACGAELIPGNLFCTSCGTKIENGEGTES